MPAIEFNRYYRHDELSSLLAEFETEFSNLVQITSIGKSHEGKDIWLATVTDKSKGKHQDKPAFWADGNIHASEVSASTTILHLLNKLCTKYGHDPEITRALETRTFYLCPRLNPDGADWSLETPPRVIRSSTRKWPYEDEELEGLERSDIDGDQRILSMRVKNDNGPWKISHLDPRLLERRDPGDTAGPFYRIFPEGLLHNYDGLTIKSRRTPEGLDINRNFPSGWRMESEQSGAGPFPTSEPEVRAMVQAVVDRPNICGSVCFHTFSGVNLRPSSRHSDDEMPAEDVWAYKKIGDAGERICGYPAISVFHDFRYHPREVITGTQDDWLFEQRGVYAWTSEIWSPQRQAGIANYKYIDWFRDHPHEDDLKLLKWSDEKLDGLGYVDWKPFNHPQLGEVEIGGWDAHYAFRNPPPQFLEAEVSPLGDWVIWQALSSPLLTERDCVVESAGQGIHRVRIAVQNAGYLPTNVTKLAADKKIVRGVIAELNREGEANSGVGQSPPAWVVSGALRQDGGQLTGWNHVPAGGFGWHADTTEDVAVFEWVVRPGTYQIEIRHERAGVVRKTMTIG